MSHLKMFGLAAVAVGAFMAFIGAGIASGTVLCKETWTTTCTATNKEYNGGQPIHIVLQVGKHATLNAAWTDVTCKTSTLQGEIASVASTGAATVINLSSVSWGECSCAGGSVGTAHPKTLETGSLAVSHINGSDDGTATGTGQKITYDCTPLGTQCIFGTTNAHLGALTGGNPATISANATVNHYNGPDDEGVFICGSTAKWEGAYEITSPKALYVSHN